MLLGMEFITSLCLRMSQFDCEYRLYGKYDRMIKYLLMRMVFIIDKFGMSCSIFRVIAFFIFFALSFIIRL